MRIIIACILSFIAMAIPFYHVEYFFGYFSPSHSDSTYYWSFRSSTATYVDSVIAKIIRHYGLHDPFYIEYPKHVAEAFSYPSVNFEAYWFDPMITWGGLSSLLITVFFMQVLTLTTGIASMFVRTRFFRPVANLSGAAIIGLMLYLSTKSLVQYNGSFELGFWLSVLAEIAIVISLV
jgi:hypothetical protein